MLLAHTSKTFSFSLYWAAISGFTVGFGDFAPATQTGRLVCIFFLPFAVAVIGEMLSQIAGVYMSHQREASESKLFQRALTLSDLKRLDADNDGIVDKTEFLTYMLVALQKVEKEDIEEIMKVFDRLDVDKSGTLTTDDLDLINGSLRSHARET